MKVDPHRHLPYTKFAETLLVGKGVWQALTPFLSLTEGILMFSFAELAHHVLHAKYHVYSVFACGKWEFFMQNCPSCNWGHQDGSFLLWFSWKKWGNCSFIISCSQQWTDLKAFLSASSMLISSAANNQLACWVTAWLSFAARRSFNPETVLKG